MTRSNVLIQDPCPFALPEISTVTCSCRSFSECAAEGFSFRGWGSGGQGVDAKSGDSIRKASAKRVRPPSASAKLPQSFRKASARRPQGVGKRPRVSDSAVCRGLMRRHLGEPRKGPWGALGSIGGPLGPPSLKDSMTQESMRLPLNQKLGL